MAFTLADALPYIVPVAITAATGILVWWLGRHDTLAKAMRDNIVLADDLRRDLWDLEIYIAEQVRPLFRSLAEKVHRATGEPITVLPPMPELRVSKNKEYDGAH